MFRQLRLVLVFTVLVLCGCTTLFSQKSALALMTQACLPSDFEPISQSQARLTVDRGDKKEHLLVLVEYDVGSSSIHLVGLNTIGAKRFEFNWSESLTEHTNRMLGQPSYRDIAFSSLSVMLLQQQLNDPSSDTGTLPTSACNMAVSENRLLSINTRLSSTFVSSVSDEHASFILRDLGYNITLSRLGP